jgi:hypothetical protein
MIFSVQTVNSAIIQAAYENQYDFIADFSTTEDGKRLLGMVKDPQTGDTLLHIAIHKFARDQKDDTLLKLISHIYILFSIENNNNQLPLELAATHGLWDFVLKKAALLKNNSRLFQGNAGLSSILIMAANNKKTLMAYKLLKLDANPNFQINNQSALSIFSDQHDWLSARIFLNPKAVQKEHWQIQTVLACLLYTCFIKDSIFQCLPFEIIKVICDFMYPNISPDFYDFNHAKEKYASGEWTKKLEEVRAKRKPTPAPKSAALSVHTVSNNATLFHEPFLATSEKKSSSRAFNFGMTPKSKVR